MTTISPSIPNKGTGDQLTASEFNALVQAVGNSAATTALAALSDTVALKASGTELSDGLALKVDATAVGLEIITRNGLNAGEVLVVNGAGTGIEGAEIVTPNWATAGDYRDGTAYDKAPNLPSLRWWSKQLAVAYGATPTISFTGDTPTHNLCSIMACTGDSAIKWAANPAALVGAFAVFKTTNSGGGARAITFVDNGTTCYVELASGVTNPGMGATAGNSLTVYYEILATDRVRIHRFDARA